jgi:PPM family protein phosphatase
VTVLRSGIATDIGRARDSNEDRAAAGDTLFAVADGMGGARGGEVAARLAIETLQTAYERNPTVAGLREAYVAANGAIWEESLRADELRGMGTTLTAAGLTVGIDGRDVLCLANVGDSRAYLMSGGQVRQITTDHSLAEERVRHGQMTEAEAEVHPHRHILTRALGVGPDVDVDLWELHVKTGDRLLLCSDGLSNEVNIEQIGQVLQSVRDPRKAARALVDRANAHGGNDNVTVVVVDVQVGEEGTAEPSVVSRIAASETGQVPRVAVASGPTEPGVSPTMTERPVVAGPVTVLQPAMPGRADGGAISPLVSGDIFVASPPPAGAPTIAPAPLYQPPQREPPRAASASGCSPAHHCQGPALHPVDSRGAGRRGRHHPLVLDGQLVRRDRPRGPGCVPRATGWFSRVQAQVVGHDKGDDRPGSAVSAASPPSHRQ